MKAIILLAGYGSRLKRDDIPHKCMLPFGDETLLSRHLRILQELGIEQTILVVGHNREAVKEYARGLNLKMPVAFVDSPEYRTTGNTLSLVLGLRDHLSGDFLAMDGDVLYPTAALADYVRQSAPSSFAVTPVDIDDTEASKVLLRPSGIIESFITKRDLTDQEKADFSVAGEAIGFFLLTEAVTRKVVELYDRKEAKYVKTLWEIIFTDIAREADIRPWAVQETGCIEIDTQEDYEDALKLFTANPAKYQA